MKKAFLFLMISAIIGMSSCTKKDDDNPAPGGGDNGNTVSGTINTNTTWTTGSIYTIDGTLRVEGATLTIEPGTVVKFTESSELDVGYSESGSVIIANGTVDKPIIFTSAAPSPAAGDWDGIWFYSGTSSETSMKYCVVEYGGGYSDYYGAVNLKDSKINFEYSSVRYSGHHGLVLDSDASFESFANNTVENIAGHIMMLYPNAVHTIGVNNTFVTSGNKGVLINGGTYNREDETWLALSVPYIIDGTVNIKSSSGSVLRIDAGAVISFTESSEMDVAYGSGEYGTLVAKGTESNRVYFTSAAASKDKGDWDGIWLYDGSNGCEFEYCTFEYAGGYSVNYGMVEIRGSDVAFTNCLFQQSETFGISLDNEAGFSSFANNTFTDNNDHAVSVYASQANTIGTGNDFITGNRGVLVKANTIEQDATWNRLNCPYFIDGNMAVASSSGATWTIEPGTIIKFTENSEVEIAYGSGNYGKIIAIGTAAEPIIFTSASPSPANGDWDGFWFYEGTSTGTEFNHCSISYAGGWSSSSGNINFKNNGENVSIKNTEISHSQYWGLYKSSGGTPTLENVTFFDNPSGDMNW